jgi:flagellar basal body L-ring protein FlgH
MKSNLILFFTLITMSSCSNYMNSIYRDFENQDRLNADIDTQQGDDSFDQYRRPNKRRSSTVYNNPSKMVTTANQKNLEPQVKRQYKDEKTALKRYTASDLTDSGNDGSLWAGSDPNAFLFSNNKTKSSGDIVQINVGNKLKDEITMELKRAFPDNPYETKAAKEGEKGKADSPPPSSEKKPAATADAPAMDVKDKISSVVVEEINREHLLIKGRKNVLFKNRKRMVEVQALVSRKDVGDDDTINSDSILESNVSVVR